MTIKSQDEYRLWAYEHQLAADLIERCEASERATLQKWPGCPTDPAEIFEILSGSTPWPNAVPVRQRERVRQAMFALAMLSDIRRHIALGHDNARLAARSALLAGMLISKGTIREVRRAQAHVAARQRGEDAKENAAKDDETIWQFADEFVQEDATEEAKIRWIKGKTLQVNTSHNEERSDDPPSVSTTTEETLTSPSVLASGAIQYGAMPPHHGPHPPVDEHTAAKYVNYTPSALRAWRRQGRGPAYIRIGRSIRYRIEDLAAWQGAHRVEPRGQR